MSVFAFLALCIPTQVLKLRWNLAAFVMLVTKATQEDHVLMSMNAWTMMDVDHARRPARTLMVATSVPATFLVTSLTQMTGILVLVSFHLAPSVHCMKVEMIAQIHFHGLMYITTLSDALNVSVGRKYLLP